MKYCLFNIAYDDSFNGFQVQPSVRTVQGEILKALEPLRIKKIFASSRTDSHVRASSNIIEMECDDCLKVCRIVDSIKGIVVRGYLASDQYVKLRGKVTKHYLYIHMERLDKQLVKTAIKEFLSSDYSNFSKDPSRKVVLDKVSCEIFTSHSAFLFVGKSFSWNFVRISAESIIKRSKGIIGDEEWAELLKGRRKYRFKGNPENLILLRTEFHTGMNEYRSRNLERYREKMLTELYWLKGMAIDLTDFGTTDQDK